MKKTERINLMMRYINNRASFTIAELMQEFQVSRSTAIRDIKEIESLGLPLIAQVGRDGGYFVMQNSLLPSIRFSDNEVKALFIAFMATRNQQLPYLKSRQSLTEKLLGLLSGPQQDDLVLLNKILLFEGTHPNNPDLLDLSDLPHPILEKLISSLLTDQVLTLCFRDKIEPLPILLLHLFLEKGSWYIEALDLKNAQKKILSVDALTDVQIASQISLSFVKKQKQKASSEKESANLILELKRQAIAQYKKYHPFKFTIAYLDPYQTQGILKAKITLEDAAEVAAIADWILFLGTDCTIRSIPPEIKEALKERTARLLGSLALDD
ncbi:MULTISPECIES: helix-turn-helix transcriptional regulator [unclassified Enterococcus]|jgi:predicted DNA-binding transcriptional regulator YafY|uniref:helix-turn-helix transcriptional regulator n=1 Tax=unclassified Enterococcus TaxID=2608891 RepID=UPI003D26BB8E